MFWTLLATTRTNTTATPHLDARQTSTTSHPKPIIDDPKAELLLQQALHSSTNIYMTLFTAWTPTLSNHSPMLSSSTTINVQQVSYQKIATSSGPVLLCLTGMKTLKLMQQHQHAMFLTAGTRAKWELYVEKKTVWILGSGLGGFCIHKSSLEVSFLDIHFVERFQVVCLFTVSS